MNDEEITIETQYTPNPERVRKFRVLFFDLSIHVTVTATPSVVRAWLKKALHRFCHNVNHRRLVVGLGVQWTSSSDAAETLQLGIGHMCLVFQIHHAPRVPLALRRFLSDSDHTFVGVWNYRDQDMLRRSQHRLLVPSLVDIRDVVADKKGWSRQLSMETLADDLLGFEDVKKPTFIGRSEWDDYPLRDEQVQYASVDAFLSFKMGKALHVWNWNR
jgi:hypothetical protein